MVTHIMFSSFLWKKNKRKQPQNDVQQQQQEHGDEQPVRHMVTSWVFGIMLPVSAITWKLLLPDEYSNKILWSVMAAFAIPIFAIVQGAFGILKYRLYFGDAPLPLTPSHGVVRMMSTGTTATTSNNSTTTTEQQQQHPAASATAAPSAHNNTTLPLRQKTRSSVTPLSLGCECHGVQKEQTCVATSRSSTTMNNNTRDDSDGGTRRRSGIIEAEVIDDEETKSPPVRLLVIGDSLAIGVGQSKQCTPVLPETIAKSLSKYLGNNRTVYWTCHGGVGASTGWIVRELERGVVGQMAAAVAATENEEEEEADPKEEEMCSDTDDDSSSDESDEKQQQQQTSASGAVWRERLAQHRKRFDPKALGPYDVVVVLTGSNDLKSAFFPFLLTGEDAEFRRQAKARGGNYTQELRRLLLTLHRQMQVKIQTIRDSVEAATETVMERVEETMSSLSSPRRSSSCGSMMMPQPPHPPMGCSFREKLDARIEARERAQSSDSTAVAAATTTTPRLQLQQQLQKHQNNNNPFPLVVLPGLPARALPIFRIAPLRWLAVPIVDILDMHKRRLSKMHPREVLFVPPPSIDDLSKYETCTGLVWNQRNQEQVALNLRDIKRRDCRRIKGELQDYYGQRDKRIPIGQGLVRKQLDRSFWFPWRNYPDRPGTSVFSVDQIHPCDDGYDFWGRYIADAIIDEWTLHPHRMPPSS